MMTLLRIFGSVHVSFKSLQTQSKPLLEKKGKKQDENLIRYPYKKNQNTIIVVTLLHELEHHKFHYEHQNFEYPPQNHPLQRTSKNKKTKHYYLQFTWLERFISYYFILSLSLCLSLSLSCFPWNSNMYIVLQWSSCFFKKLCHVKAIWIVPQITNPCIASQ